MFIAKNDYNDEVKTFCKENNIEYSWDWNYKDGVWHEILFDGKLLMQITKGISLWQFLNVIKILSKNFYADSFPDDGIEFVVCMKQDKEHEVLFSKFIERHSNVLRIN